MTRTGLDASASSTGSAAATRLFAGPGEMRERCRALDWSATPLGAVDEWSHSARTAAVLTLSASFPAVLLWGPELVQLYNDAHRPVMGAKHPFGLGRSVREVWPEVWAAMAPLYERVLRGETVVQEDAELSLQREGPDAPPRPAYFSLTMSPVPDDGGDVGGIFVSVVETTARVLDRRLVEERDRLAEDAARAERRALRLLEQVSDAHITLDRDFRFVAVNSAAERALGKRREEMIGRAHWDVFPASAGSEMEEQYRRVASSGVEAHFAHHYVGEGYDVHLEIDAYPTDRGGVAVFWRDVTARVHADRALRDAYAALEARNAQLMAQAGALEHANWELQKKASELEAKTRTLQFTAAALADSEERFRAVQDASPDASLLARAVRDETGRIVDFLFTYANAATERVLLGRAEIVVGRTMREAFPESVAAGRLERYAEVVESGEHWLEDVHYTRGEVAHGLRVTAVKVGDGVHIGAADLSERIQAAEERERLLQAAEHARAEAEAANRAKSEFLTVMSHELRTPLNAIAGYTQLLQLGVHGPATPEQLNALERIQRSQRHLLGLINDVLNFAKIESGHVEYTITDVDVGAAIEALEPLVAPQLRAKSLRYSHDHCLAPMRTRADAEKLRQVLLNLLSNAIKFTADGGEIAITCAEREDVVAIAVRDTGHGIPADRLEEIFAPFVQVARRYSTPHEGTGLGLAISRDLARGMGGDLTVESREGEGSVFTLTLRRA